MQFVRDFPQIILLKIRNLLSQHPESAIYSFKNRQAAEAFLLALSHDPTFLSRSLFCFIACQFCPQQVVTHLLFVFSSRTFSTFFVDFYVFPICSHNIFTFSALYDILFTVKEKLFSYQTGGFYYV